MQWRRALLREPEGADHEGYLQDATADPQKARNEADQDSGHRPLGDSDPVDVTPAAAVD